MLTDECFALALPATAFAHANLLQRTPNFGARLKSGPPAVSLRFDQGVDVFSNGIQVVSSTGKDVTAGPASAIDGKRVATVPLKRLPKGAYTIRWHVTSFEGHVLSGVYTFGVRVVPPPPTEAYGAAGPTTWPMSPASRAAAVGAKVLAVDRRALGALRALTPPAGEAATIRGLLGLADKAINTGIARVVAAARTGNNSAYMAAARRANALINTAHAAARRYGFSACARW